jgi:hypothetical protein
VRVAAVPDHFFEQASQNRLRELAGIGVNSVTDMARELAESTARTLHAIEISTVAD